MKVNTNTPSNPGIAIEKTKTQGIENQEKAIQNKGKGTAREGASVDISDDALLLKKAADIVRQLPENGQTDRINQLKKSIQEGSYQVSAESIADKLVEEHFTSHLGKNSL